MKLLEWISEAVGWVLIALSPTGIAGFIGYFLKDNFPEPWNWVVFAGISTAGFVLGAWIATRQARGRGTVAFLSRAEASPDIDEWLRREKDERHP